MDKAEGAFLTIGELSRELGVAQHILRYWETRFSQLRPLQRSGNRRYYRPADVALARRIDALLNKQGFTVRGAQRLLDGHAEPEPAPPPLVATPPAGVTPASDPARQPQLLLGDEDARNQATRQCDAADIAILIARLSVIRDNLKDAIGAG